MELLECFLINKLLHWNKGDEHPKMHNNVQESKSFWRKSNETN